MTTEGRIPVLVGGPANGEPAPSGPLAPAHWLELSDDAENPHVYRRRTFAVGATSVHVWVFGDPAGGATDAEAAELMWRWLLDAAGVLEEST